MNKNRLKTLLILLPLLASLPAWGQFDNAFQSTSTMPGSGSAYASNPTINGNGMVEQPVAMESLHNGRGGNTPNPQRPGTPIGSALPALLLLAGGYAGVVALRKRKERP